MKLYWGVYTFYTILYIKEMTYKEMFALTYGHGLGMIESKKFIWNGDTNESEKCTWKSNRRK